MSISERKVNTGVYDVETGTLILRSHGRGAKRKYFTVATAKAAKLKQTYASQAAAQVRERYGVPDCTRRDLKRRARVVAATRPVFRQVIRTVQPPPLGSIAFALLYGR